MARNNYYNPESFSDSQFASGYATNVPSSPDTVGYSPDSQTGSQYASSYATNVPTSPTSGDGSRYVGPTQAPSESAAFSGYVPTQPMQDAYVETEVETSKNSIHSVILVVGWLVCTKGESIGQDYRLHVGWNYIGRDQSQDIVLSDPKVSHHMAKVSYDPESRTFGVAPSEGAKSLCYLNGKPLRGDRDFEAYDRLRIGDTELMLLPLCGEKFSWEFSE